MTLDVSDVLVWYSYCTHIYCSGSLSVLYPFWYPLYWWSSEKFGIRVWVGFICLIILTSGGLLWTRRWTCQLCKRRELYLLG